MSTTTTTGTQLNLPRITLWLAIYAAAAIAGALLGFNFARSAGGGFWMGVVAGANAAVFSTLLADWVAGRLAKRR
jgi:ABC-type Fe3+-siderophore transport system permease subunit